MRSAPQGGGTERMFGTFTRGGQPVTGQEFTLSMRDSNISFDWTEYKAATDENGRFAFDRVPFGGIQIGRLVHRLCDK